MRRPHVTALLAATLFLAPFALAASSSSASPAGQDAPPPHPGMMAMPQPTNLKVLPKDISAPDLMNLMHNYSQALGVHCSYCHEQNPQTHHMDFASDAKPEKATARTMIAMTAEINQKFMSQIQDPDATPEDKKVGCATCHRGSAMPEHFTPPAAEEHHDAPKPQQ
ncbi:c-type cytochrome [Silvibacterium sp.]|uniref:c-type cytochrome n=1 Tax=Silvibacterium sp. TaxID=1964179 RepID=UPI0039E3540C